MHNSIPCKLTQQIRCEDLGYDWYEGTALGLMEGQGTTENGEILDLSDQYPVRRKGDGKPIEGDTEGICVYPNYHNDFLAPPGDYFIKGDYIGKQAIILKWWEYGTGWWSDDSLNI